MTAMRARFHTPHRNGTTVEAALLTTAQRRERRLLIMAGLDPGQVDAWLASGGKVAIRPVGGEGGTR